MKILKLFGSALLLSLCAHAAFADTAQEANVKKLMQARMGEQAKIISVTKTPYSGLFEVRTEDDIVYTDAAAQYMIVGHVIDTKSYRDYTGMRLEEISRVAFSDLPLDAAMKQVKGNGKRVIAVFEDPNCGYCKRFRQTLQETDDVTIYTFMLNILAPDSATKSRNIWCSADRVKAWDDWMLNGKAAPDAPAGCTAPNEQVLKLGKKMRVMGTPTIVFADGSRMQGALDKAALEQKFAAVK